jgi:hypothetical protein
VIDKTATGDIIADTFAHCNQVVFVDFSQASGLSLRILDNAFRSLANLENVDMGGALNLLWIASSSFKDCPKLQYVKLPSALTTLGSVSSGGSSFSNTKLAQPSNIDWNGLSCNDLVAGGAAFEFVCELAHFDLVDSAGSTSGFSATLTGGAAATTSPSTGVVFDGVDDYATLVRPSTVVISGPISVEVVVKWTSFKSNSMVFDCGYAGTIGNIRIGNGGTVGTVHWQIVEGVETYSAVSTAGFIAENQWYHIVGTVAGSSGSATMVLYIDGVAVTTVTNGKEPTHGGDENVQRPNCYIGKSYHTAAGYFHGEVASLKIYTGAMSTAQVTAAYGVFNYVYTSTTVCQNMANYYPGNQNPLQHDVLYYNNTVPC